MASSRAANSGINGVEPHDPAELGFEGHEVEEQAVFLRRMFIHGHTLPFDELLKVSPY